MRNLIFGLAMVSFMALFSCDDEKESSECPPADRVGARCEDGTTSQATGSGACSGHGGVEA